MRLLALAGFVGLLTLARPAAAQLQESFTDGDFTQNPAWSGQTADFLVNPALRLQSNGPAVTTTVRALATPCRVSGAAVWEFWANLKFATSSGNLADVFLLSDSARLQGGGHGYFVRLGGTPDEVALFRKDGPTAAPVYVVDGPDGLLASSTDNLVRIRVTRDAAAEWTLEADPTGAGTAYALQGTGIDSTYRNAQWLGVLTRYSATNNLKFFFDDFRVTDTAPPSLRAVASTSATTLRLTFDEPLAGAQTPGTYTLAGLGAATAATLDPQNAAVVNLTFGATLPAGRNVLTVGVAEDLYGNVTPGPLRGAFQFAIPATPPAPGELLINELYIDPSPVVGLPPGPFVELLNVSARPLDLTGCRLRDATATGSGGTLLPPVAARVLAPGQTAVLCRTADTAAYRLLLAPLGLRPVPVSSFPTFNLSGDQVRLFNATGQRLDYLRYTDAWYQDPVKKLGGWSLEKRNPLLTCADATNWLASTDPSGGTPGRRNSVFSSGPDTTPPVLAGATLRNALTVALTFSEPIDTASAPLTAFALTPGGGARFTAVRYVPDSLRVVLLTLSAPLTQGVSYALTASGLRDCPGNVAPALTAPLLLAVAPAPGDVVINELYIDSNPVVGLPTGQFVEILNVSTKTLDLTGWKLQDLSTVGANAGGRLTGGRLAPGQYAVLCPVADTAAYRGLLAPLGVRPVPVTSFPLLNQSGDQVRLLGPGGIPELDRLTYTDAWYQDAAKQAGGWSLEKRNPLLTCPDGANWQASTDPSGGTPGRRNSTYDPTPDTRPPGLVRVAVPDGQTLVVTFSEPVDSLSAGPGAFRLDPALPISQTAFDPNQRATVTLRLGAPLAAGVRYTLFTTGIRDCAGNAPAVPLAIAVGLGTEPGLYELEITEILADETPNFGNLPLTEYIEIHNPTARLLDLSDISLRKQGATGNAARFPAGATLAPGAYAIVCGSTRGALFGQYQAPVFPLTNFPALNNSGDTLVLRRPDGQLLFSVAYRDAWYRDPEKQAGGWSLEMIDTAWPCGGAPNWTASVSGGNGTPGQPNSVRAALPDQVPPAVESARVLPDGRRVRIRFTEKLDSLSTLDPAAYALTLPGAAAPTVTGARVRGPEFREVDLTLAAPLAVGLTYRLRFGTGGTGTARVTDCAGNAAPDTLTAALLVPETPRPGDVVVNEILFNPRPGGADFVEIYNRSTRVLDLSGWLLANLRGDSLYQPRPLPPFTLRPGALVAVSPQPDSVAKQYPLSVDRARLLAVAALPSYPDDAGTVVLLGPDSTVLDQVAYDQRQHFALLNNAEGVSLERLDANGPSEAANFASATADVGFATPGRANSQRRTATTPPENALQIEPRVIPPGMTSFALISYALPAPGYVGNLTIFDAQGRRTRRLVQQQTLSQTGAFQWDGSTDDRQPAPTGYYLVYAEFFDLSGALTVVKQTVAVAPR